MRNCRLMRSEQFSATSCIETKSYFDMMMMVTRLVGHMPYCAPLPFCW